MSKLTGKDRAVVLAQLAVQIENGSHHAQWGIEDSVKRAEDVLTQAENLVAEKYGEFR